MGSNSQGSYRISRAAFFDRFDRLPRSVRERLCEAICDWVASPLCKLWESEQFTPNQLIATILDWDCHDRRQHFARLLRMAETGVDYNARLPNASFKKYDAKAQRAGLV